MHMQDVCATLREKRGAAMALDQGEEAQIRELIVSELDRSLAQRIPRLMRFEQFLKPVVAGITLAIGLPLSYFGLEALVEKHATQTFKTIQETDENGPLHKLKAFSSGLKATFEGQVDSATFKMLRFGCNAEGLNPAAKFPGCAAASTTASQQAQAALDEEEQTIAFAARPKLQNITLALVLRPVDTPDALSHVALDIDWIPLDIRKGGTRQKKTIQLDISQVAKRGFFLDKDGGLLALYGVASGLEDQTLNLTIDLTSALKDIDADLHQIRVRAVPNPKDEAKAFNGTERFFLRALVSVNHRVTAQ
jgi:hypothetical protein